MPTRPKRNEFVETVVLKFSNRTGNIIETIGGSSVYDHLTHSFVTCLISVSFRM